MIPEDKKTIKVNEMEKSNQDIQTANIHSTAIVDKTVTYGKNFSLGMFSNIDKNVIIGDNVTIKDRVRIDPGARIGNNVFIRGNTVICTDMIIEDFVELGHQIVCTNHKLLSKWRSYLGDPTEPPHICRGARVGASVTLFPGVKLGKNCIVGMGAIVLKDVPENAIVVGVPPKQIGIVPENERI